MQPKQAVIKISGFSNLHPSNPIPKKRLQFEHLVVNIINKKIEIGAYFDVSSKGETLRHEIKAFLNPPIPNLPIILDPEFLQKAPFKFKYLVSYDISITKDNNKDLKFELMTLYFPFKTEKLEDFTFITRNMKAGSEYEEIHYIPTNFTLIND